jgi:CubicO group peptidase (beta-lactamase class C family)
MTSSAFRKALAGTCLACLVVPAAANNNAAGPSELVGLWTATKRLGPDARGPIIVEQVGGSWQADFLGNVYPLRLAGHDLLFELPSAKGSFSLPLPKPNAPAVGHWFSPVSPVHDNPFAVPVALTPNGPSRWRGLVQPMDDKVTLYLKVDQSADGTLHAFLRNPDRNIGTDFNVDEIQSSGDQLTLLGHHFGESGPHKPLLSGSFDRAHDALLVTLPWTGDDIYRFTRDDRNSGFYPRPAGASHYVYRRPEQLHDGWPVASLDDVGISRIGIETFIQSLIDMPIDSLHSPEVEAVLVARHGKLVLDEYFHGFDRDMLHETRSAAKSVTAVLVGAAMQAGEPVALSDPVYKVMNGGEFPANLDPRKRQMTLEHLLMMRSGYFCDDSNPEAPGNEDLMQEKAAAGVAPDNIKYTLSVPMAYAPNEVAIYCSASPNLALAMVGRSTGEPVLDTFDRLVAKPLGIDRYSWPLDRAGNPYGGGGVRLLPRDFLKMAQMLMDGGTWHGRRIISRAYAQRASAPLHQLNRIQYGYLWWSIELPYKKRKVRAFFAGGNGGQGVFAIPELDLAIGIFGGNYRDAVGLHVQEDLPANFILPAVLEKGDDPRAPVMPGTFHTPYGHPSTPDRE